MSIINLYNFTLEGIKPTFGKSGIYGIFYGDECIYVGQSINIGKRLRDHRSENAFTNTLHKILKEGGKHNRCKELALYHFINEHRVNIKYGILAEAQKDELNKLEYQYILQYQPRFNYEGIDRDYRGR